MIRNLIATLTFLAASTGAALGDPPTDLDACLKLSEDTSKAANVTTEAQYVKFHFKMLDLNSACGTQDFAGAEKIAAEILATFPRQK